ncbi:hypothetical protein H2200_010327 [Cladophialophora chaetospira]|uniref:Uncharacterized protein n=1 Tax=Cladophialophora chaetospira TaxID=386627 RepID=A0AA38X184_9EURO|nr:hypothetical protein H2200_010327 [Cladophialophora chaetospira]
MSTYAIPLCQGANSVLHYFATRLGNDQETVFLFTRLFYAIGSAEAIDHLKQALISARKGRSRVALEGQHDLRTTFTALDDLDELSALSSILRRHYLVKLLRYRQEQERIHQKTRNVFKKAKRSHKYDVNNVQRLASGDLTAVESLKVSGAARNTSRADSRALTTLMATIYPALQPAVKGPGSLSDTEYQRKLQRLKNRITCARNWMKFEQDYSASILALIPSGGPYKISTDQ